MSRRVSLALFLLFQGCLNAEPVLINAVAGKVGDRLVTIQDAYFYRGLQRIRAGEHPVVLFETDKNLKATVQKVMFETMILEEAQVVDFKDPDVKRTNEIIKKAKDQGQGVEWNRLLKTFAISESDAIKKLSQGVLAEKFLKKKIDSLTPVITEVELEQYISNHPEKVKKLGDKNRLLITEALKKEKIDKGLQDYIDFLTEKYSATLILS